MNEGEMHYILREIKYTWRVWDLRQWRLKVWSSGLWHCVVIWVY